MLVEQGSSQSWCRAPSLPPQIAGPHRDDTSGSQSGKQACKLGFSQRRSTASSIKGNREPVYLHKKPTDASAARPRRSKVALTHLAHDDDERGHRRGLLRIRLQAVRVQRRRDQLHAEVRDAAADVRRHVPPPLLRLLQPHAPHDHADRGEHEPGPARQQPHLRLARSAGAPRAKAYEAVAAPPGELLAEHGADDERDELQADLRVVEPELGGEELRDEHGDVHAAVGERDGVGEHAEEDGQAGRHQQRIDELGGPDRARVDTREVQAGSPSCAGSLHGIVRRKLLAVWTTRGSHVEGLGSEKEVSKEQGQAENGDHVEQPLPTLSLDNESSNYDREV
jgi:hypothetical protein